MTHITITTPMEQKLSIIGRVPNFQLICSFHITEQKRFCQYIEKHFDVRQMQFAGYGANAVTKVKFTAQGKTAKEVYYLVHVAAQKYLQ